MVVHYFIKFVHNKKLEHLTRCPAKEPDGISVYSKVRKQASHYTRTWKASGVRYWKAWPGDFIWLERKSQMNQELRDNSYHNFLEIVCIEGRITKKSPEGVWAFKFGIKEESVMEIKDQRERQEDI